MSETVLTRLFGEIKEEIKKGFFEAIQPQIKEAMESAFDHSWDAAMLRLQAPSQEKPGRALPKEESAAAVRPRPASNGFGYSQPDRGNHGSKPAFSGGQRGGFLNGWDDRHWECMGDQPDYPDRRQGGRGGHGEAGRGTAAVASEMKLANRRTFSPDEDLQTECRSRLP